MLDHAFNPGMGVRAIRKSRGAQLYPLVQAVSHPHFAAVFRDDGMVVGAS